MDRTPPRSREVRSALGVTALALAACAAFATDEASAQDARTMSRNEVLEELFGGLSPNSGLRVVTIGGVVEEGRLQGVDPGGVAVLREGGTYSVGYQDVRSVQLEGGHGTQGAIWGAASGAVVGIFFGAMYASFNCQTASDCNYTEKEGAWRWGAFLGGVGGGIGFLIGRRSVHWHPIFP